MVWILWRVMEVCEEDHSAILNFSIMVSVITGMIPHGIQLHILEITLAQAAFSQVAISPLEYCKRKVFCESEIQFIVVLIIRFCQLFCSGSGCSR